MMPPKIIQGSGLDFFTFQLGLGRSLKICIRMFADKIGSTLNFKINLFQMVPSQNQTMAPPLY